jgi:hypothetical protein
MKPSKRQQEILDLMKAGACAYYFAGTGKQKGLWDIPSVGACTPAIKKLLSLDLIELTTADWWPGAIAKYKGGNHEIQHPYVHN